MVDVEKMRQISGERRTLRVLFCILSDWVAILLALYLWSVFPFWWIGVLAVFIVGIEQHALGLWGHESAHWLLSSKRANDFISRAFIMGPTILPLSVYRQRHFAHHGYLGTERDTKRIIFRDIRGWRLASYVADTLLGVAFFRVVHGYFFGKQEPTLALKRDRELVMDIVSILLAQVVIFFICYGITGGPFAYVVFWLLPWLTVSRFLAGLRSVIEHQPMSGESYPLTRLFHPTLFDRFLFSRAGFDRHWVHHQYPNVPCFNLFYFETTYTRPVRGYLDTLSRIVRGQGAL